MKKILLGREYKKLYRIVNTYSAVSNINCSFRHIKNIFNDIGNGNVIQEVDTNMIVENKSVDWTSHINFLGTKHRLNNIDTIRYLVEHGADISCNNHHLLYWAANNNYFDIFKYLVESGADIKCNDNWILRNAIHNNNMTIAKYVIDKGADVNFGQGIGLGIAASNGCLSMIKLLIQNGLSIDSHNNHAIKMAVSNKFVNIVEFLINNGVDKNIALQLAAKFGSLEIIDYLIQNGANIHDMNALNNAINYNNIEILEYLIAHGSLNLKDNKYLAISKSIEKDLSNKNYIFTNILLKYNVDIEMIKKYASENKYTTLITYLNEYKFIN